MTEHHKVFRIETHDDTLFLVACGYDGAFRYQDIQMESNVIRGILAKTKFKGMVIDLGALEYFGSELIGVIISIARDGKNRGVNVALCCASDKMKQVLGNMKVSKIWPHFDTREEAIAAVS